MTQVAPKAKASHILLSHLEKLKPSPDIYKISSIMLTWIHWSNLLASRNPRHNLRELLERPRYTAQYKDALEAGS
jgi:hypothetical protein